MTISLLSKLADSLAALEFAGVSIQDDKQRSWISEAIDPLRELLQKNEKGRQNHHTKHALMGDPVNDLFTVALPLIVLAVIQIN